MQFDDLLTPSYSYLNKEVRPETVAIYSTPLMSNGKRKVKHVNDIWPVPVLSVPFRKGFTGAYAELSRTERIRICSVPTFLLPVMLVEGRLFN